MLEKGLPPVAGGMLDQPAWFMAFARQMQREDAKVMKELTNGN